ncbi:hypothetical protein SPRG_14010 [Saprolegnia parasitica CBS 223.65]|uniref:Cyclin-like domain-containing protein n=1 Tax=Saprolegnia parasitica (strain CBS 223.65) TaxID=695850 RepID=A0A067C0Y8_SAPPC|nr:hypothetical protein SPRG_14010 [Saprolegnia parasitica CBS 223.65]KDO20492.1 hypothetical protein SPRG_14010 [Saprolegnia parasitica CBS 223.65]|eukprot:XP_012208817.1 hypothetical protein SPRG_14010 [Saprolegnia parasitica CBS 223.65]
MKSNMDLICHEEPAITASSLSLEAIEDSLAMLTRHQTASMPNASYLATVQTHGMVLEWRSNVVSWMTNLAGMLTFEVKTTALALNYFDRYLSVRSVQKKDVELLAMACVLAASKFNEQDALTVTEAVSIAADFSAADIVGAEKDLLKVLEWKLVAALPHDFLESYLALLDADATVLDLCLDLVSRTAEDMSLLEYLPSTIALAVVSVACDMLHMPFPRARFALDASFGVVKEAVYALAHPAAPVEVECATPTAPSKLKRSASPSGVEDVYSYDSPVCIKRQRLYSA